MNYDGYQDMDGNYQWFDGETANVIGKEDKLWVKVADDRNTFNMAAAGILDNIPESTSSGEIKPYDSNFFEELRDAGVEKGIPGTETIYNILDDVFVFVTSFDLINPTGQPMHLNGNASIRGSQEHIDSGINGFIAVMPMPTFNIHGFNIAQSNKFFKGTWYNKLPSVVKGKSLKLFNYLMKSIITPKKVVKQTKSNLEKVKE